ncbi:MAG: gamma-glutamylcyclotransferase family protein [Hyphomicrobium sp.]|jgi:gamma-glutamylcyclotransferase (GGCT)/AIG2-like uncharacterized protein YtfP
MTDKDSRYLFVYGTLMSGARGALGKEERLRLARESDSLGPASFPGAHLFDLGKYPGALPASDIDAIVHGELLLLENPQASLTWLDPYEGFVHGADDNEYDRIICQVRLAGGETLDAWVYVLRRVPANKTRVVSGRWGGR